MLRVLCSTTPAAFRDSRAFDWQMLHGECFLGGTMIVLSGPLSRSSHRDNGALSHLNRCIDGVLEIVRVIGRRLVSIAEVHAIVAGAYLAQSELETACNGFGFLKRHRLPSSPLAALLSHVTGFFKQSGRAVTMTTTSSACRQVPVLSKIFLRCVRAVS